MTTYYSTYWNAYIVQYKDQEGFLRTFMATNRQRAIEKALQAISNDNKQNND